uniref:Uncharacterized protein n=1 Tax=Timema bartmani TaxID=61472 RepID=A0A7R9F9Z8_9NEOP|nr:unnamed protein product [Timema bartmani]
MSSQMARLSSAIVHRPSSSSGCTDLVVASFTETMLPEQISSTPTGVNLGGPENAAANHQGSISAPCKDPGLWPEIKNELRDCQFTVLEQNLDADFSVSTRKYSDKEKHIKKNPFLENFIMGRHKKDGTQGERHFDEGLRAARYQLLVEESRAAHINDEPQVQTVLQQLLQSNTTNLSGIHKPQEKLCMLVMSLHPQELCTLHWQAALKFVFEEILEGAEGTVEVWVQKRGLPLMI